MDPTCSFCGKKQSDVGRIVAGPTVGICNECVALCIDVLDTSAANPGAVTSADETKPGPAILAGPASATWLAPFFATRVGGMPDNELALVAKAIADEQAKRARGK